MNRPSTRLRCRGFVCVCVCVCVSMANAYKRKQGKLGNGRDKERRSGHGLHNIFIFCCFTASIVYRASFGVQRSTVDGSEWIIARSKPGPVFLCGSGRGRGQKERSIISGRRRSEKLHSDYTT